MAPWPNMPTLQHWSGDTTHLCKECPYTQVWNKLITWFNLQGLPQSTEASSINGWWRKRRTKINKQNRLLFKDLWYIFGGTYGRNATVELLTISHKRKRRSLFSVKRMSNSMFWRRRHRWRGLFSGHSAPINAQLQPCWNRPFSVTFLMGEWMLEDWWTSITTSTKALS